MAVQETMDFKAPVRLVKEAADMDKWLNSEAYVEFDGFIKLLCDSVRGTKLTDNIATSPSVDRLLAVLDKLSQWIDEIPPVDPEEQRFGNKAFREWWFRVRDNCQDLIREILPEELKSAAVELEPYLREGFGNATRIDYGTGHELKFTAFIFCLMKIQAIRKEQAAAVALRVYTRYLDLVHKLQSTYRMEPAGSHGVWGLDDFQFVPFIWGAAQLIGQNEVLPKALSDPAIAKDLSADYLFLSCINYINTVKTGPFFEHSPTLWSISEVPDWTKVKAGLIKMYKGEVLGKFPVIQHFPFGTILSLTSAK